jgi:hypothetical protein
MNQIFLVYMDEFWSSFASYLNYKLVDGSYGHMYNCFMFYAKDCLEKIYGVIETKKWRWV